MPGPGMPRSGPMGGMRGRMAGLGISPSDFDAQNYAGYVSYDFAVYVLQINALAGGQQQTGNITIEADSDFICEQLTWQPDNNSGTAETWNTQIIPLIQFNMFDTGSGRQFFSQSTGMAGVFGDGSLPFVLTRPRIFQSNSTVRFSFNNYSTADTYNFTMNLVGFKGFRS